LRHDRITDWIRLGLRRFLPRLRRHRALIDADQRLAVGAVENVDPPVRPASAIALRGWALTVVSKRTTGLAALSS
jgi:hypothetical protein